MVLLHKRTGHVNSCDTLKTFNDQLLQYMSYILCSILLPLPKNGHEYALLCTLLSYGDPVVFCIFWNFTPIAINVCMYDSCRLHQFNVDFGVGDPQNYVHIYTYLHTH